MTICDAFFIFGLCVLCAALPFNYEFYPVLYVTTGAAGLVLWMHRASFNQASARLLAPSCAFLALAAVTPNNLFSDLPAVTVMAASYACGLAAAQMKEHRTIFNAAVLCLGTVLSVQLSVSLLVGMPSSMLWNGRLTLCFDHPAVLANVAGWTSLYLLSSPVNGSLVLRAFSLYTVCCCLGIVALTTSRGAFAGLFCALFLLICTRFRNHIWKALLVGAIFCMVAFIMAPAEHRERLISGVRNPFADANMLSRMAIWEPALDGFRNAPLFGQGIRRFRTYHETYVATHLTDMETRYSVVERGIANPHSLYVGLLFAYGLVGTVLFGATLLQTGFRAFHTGELFLPCLLLFYLGSGFTDYPLHRKDGIFLLFLPLGFFWGRQLVMNFTKH